jgi:FkbM family methyltransferase
MTIASPTRSSRRLLNYLRYKTTPQFLTPKSPALRDIDGVRFECFPERDRNYRRMYFGVYETDIVALMSELLQVGDTFLDVGANVGYLSAVAASLVGPAGQVHSFEPVPKYFAALSRMAEINPAHQVCVNQQALGDASGTANIAVTNLANMGWNTLVPEFMAAGTVDETVEVPVGRLDDYIETHALDNIALIKIDVEGYEFPALRGLSRILAQPDRRCPILCEIAPSAYPLLNTSLAELRDWMRTHGYEAHQTSAARPPIDITTFDATTDVLFTPTTRD